MVKSLVPAHNKRQAFSGEILRSLGRGLIVGGFSAAACSSILESSSYVVREYTIPLLPPHSPSLRILHISDIHMMPWNIKKQHFISQLIDLAPDLVINTGDNLAHQSSVKYVVQSLGDLLSVPGVYVFGSNDYYEPVFKNPLSYLGSRSKAHNAAPKTKRQVLPWRDLKAAFTERGWLDATNTKHHLTVAGVTVEVGGVDDPHINHDDYDAIAGLTDITASLRLGVSHSPEPRILDRFAADGYNLVLSGHTHGGQICLPKYGAIVTNCGLDRKLAKGFRMWKNTGMYLHVSAGLGTSPFFPVRTFCKPEVSILNLVGAKVEDDEDNQVINDDVLDRSHIKL